MKNSIEESVAQMDWRDVRQTLKKSKTETRGTERINAREENLRQYFGESRYRELTLLSLSADKIRSELGNVVLLPGIMGSHLSVTDASGDEDHVWFSLWRIVKGDMKRLRLGKNGAANAGRETVKATGLIGWYYALALETLQAEPFPYDWRLDTRETARKLKQFVEDKFADKTFDENRPVHFVAHSMGGLVVRNLIHQFKDFWRDKGGRLVMLGTPNAGSFAAVETLMGKNSLVKYLAAADILQNKSDWFEVINSFVGLYQLFPSKLVNPDVYEKKIWENFPDVLFDDYLQTLPKFHQDLFDAREATADKNRMTYIAGIGYETPSGLKSLEGGGYEFDSTLDGDGTVSHALGLLENVATYYVEDTPHGSLPNNRKVLDAVRDILRNGATQILPTKKPIVSRSRAAHAAPVIKYELERVEAVACQMRGGQTPEPIIVADAEKILLRSLLGGEEREDQGLELITFGQPKTVKPLALETELIFGDITRVDAPVIVIGQYQNLPPGGAGNSVNRKINNWIKDAYDSEMLGMNLGQLFIVPLGNQKNVRLEKSIENVIIAGMGQYGTFSREDLRYLMMNVTLAAMRLGYDRLATVLIGASIESFSVERAIRGVWYGVSDAVARLPENHPLEKFSLLIVEANERRQEQIAEAVGKITAAQKDANEKSPKGKARPAEPYEFENLRITLREPKKLQPVETEEAEAEAGKRRNFGITRINISRRLGKLDDAGDNCECGSFELSAFTSNAAIPLRQISVNDQILNQLIDDLRYAGSAVKQENYGKLLHFMLMPEDFETVLDSDKALTLVVNREASAIPWEMLCFGGAGRIANFGADLRVSRQFSSLRASIPGAVPPLNKQFKALVIADPAPEEELQLAGARAEGVLLRDFFRRKQIKLKKEQDIDLQFQVRIGHEECDIVQILSLIYNEQFDLIHFAGHGVYDPNNLSRSGWVFGRKTILSAQEIFSLRRVPRLVFANACFSAELSTVESNSRLAGLAEAFFNRGVENYIGAGWQVNDRHAIDFAQTFYEKTLDDGSTLGEALSDARKAVAPRYAKNASPTDTTWGAYQHYGDSNARLVI